MTELDPPWDGMVSDLVEILAQLGETDDAARILDICRDSTRRLRWLFDGSVELRCLALLRAAAGHLEEALDLLDEAVAHLDRGRGSMWLGRTLLARGGVLRLQGREAEAASDLERALAMLNRHGPPSWRAAAQRALASAGDGDPPREHGTDPAGIVAVLTARHWCEREIVTGLRRSLQAVQLQLGLASGHLAEGPDGGAAERHRWRLGA